MKNQVKRNVEEQRRAIRTKGQPVVRDDIDTLVKNFLKSANYKAFKKRYSRK